MPWEIEVTPTQQKLLAGPKTLDSLKVADFLGRQTYIDDWIRDWLLHNQYTEAELPLCVSESIVCDSSLRRVYKKAVRQAVVSNRVEWLQKHYIVPTDLWAVVDFLSVSEAMFDVLWCQKPAKKSLCAFIVQSRRLPFLERFVREYGPTDCLQHVMQTRWLPAVEFCLAEGADIETRDVVQYCVRFPELFRAVTLYNPPATQEAYDEFLLQRLLHRVEDVPLVEEWFWIHGFRSQ